MRGGAFLLLDPRQPEFRRLPLKEAGIALVIADEAFAEVETFSAAALLADAEKASGDDPADGGFARRPAAAPAYVVFTPGSTGQPRVWSSIRRTFSPLPPPNWRRCTHGCPKAVR